MKALEPEVEEFKPVKREPKKEGRRAPKKETAEAIQPEEPKEPELTAFQIAWQQAMEKADDSRSFKVKREKPTLSREQTELLNRTLEKRLPTGG